VKAGQGLGLALGEAKREPMSEAGPAGNPCRYQWRLIGLRLERKRQAGWWDLPMEGASSHSNACGLDGRRGRWLWPCTAELGMPGEAG